MHLGNTAKLFIAIFIAELAGIIGSVFTASSVTTWYRTLVMPEFSPPGWVFGPVWTTLYALMGIALWLVWKEDAAAPTARRIAFLFFFIQLFLNTLWSVIFFGAQNPGLAFGEIILLWLSIVGTMIAFAKVSKPAAWLFAPYLLWVSFAAYLNYALWILNR